VQPASSRSHHGERRDFSRIDSRLEAHVLLEERSGGRGHFHEFGPPDWFEYLRILGVPPGFLSGVRSRPPSTSWSHASAARTSRLRWRSISAAIAGSTTSQRWSAPRRRGLGTALTAVHVHDALARGCQTASLQSTEMAERVYAAVGFRDLGRTLKYVP
jgi:hypothetical protein